MINLWRTLSNRMRLRNAHQGMKELGIDDSVDAPFLDALHQFAAIPAAPAPVPVALIEAFNKAQLRKKSRRNLRITAAALLGGSILIPGLAYAGVLPPQVARMVQRVLNVTRIPITLPANTTDSSANRNGSIPLPTNTIPNLGAGTVLNLAGILPPLLPDSTSVDEVSTWGVASPLVSTGSNDGSDTPTGNDQVNLPIEVTLSPDATPTDEPTPTDTPSPDATPTDEPTPTDTPSPDATPTDTPLEILPAP